MPDAPELPRGEPGHSSRRAAEEAEGDEDRPGGLPARGRPAGPEVESSRLEPAREGHREPGATRVAGHRERAGEFGPLEGTPPGDLRGELAAFRGGDLGDKQSLRPDRGHPRRAPAPAPAQGFKAGLADRRRRHHLTGAPGSRLAPSGPAPPRGGSDVQPRPLHGPEAPVLRRGVPGTQPGELEEALRHSITPGDEAALLQGGWAAALTGERGEEGEGRRHALRGRAARLRARDLLQGRPQGLGGRGVAPGARRRPSQGLGTLDPLPPQRLRVEHTRLAGRGPQGEGFEDARGRPCPVPAPAPAPVPARAVSREPARLHPRAGEGGARGSQGGGGAAGRGEPDYLVPRGQGQHLVGGQPFLQQGLGRVAAR